MFVTLSPLPACVLPAVKSLKIPPSPTRLSQQDLLSLRASDILVDTLLADSLLEMRHAQDIQLSAPGLG